MLPLPTTVLLLLVAAAVPAAAAYEVVWDSWYPAQCRKHGDTTTAADFKRFSIAVNSEDINPGIPNLPPQPPSNNTGHAADKIVLFYENFGLYPAIGAHAGNFSGTSLYMCDPQQVVKGQPHWCNGGVPQRTNLTAHAAKIRSDIETAIPDPDWDGLAFIDYESWQPIWDWNANCCPQYQQASIALVKAEHPTWSVAKVQAQAQEEMEAAGLAFLKQTITVARAARPKAKWGIDGYVSCGDSMDDYSGVGQSRCPATAMAGNDKLQSLLAIQDIVVPMSYLLSLNASYNEGYLRAVFAESERVAPGKPIYYHAWYEYLLQGAPTVPQKPTCEHAPNGDYAPNCLLSRENLDVMLEVPKWAGVKGTVIWGGGADQGTAALCQSFKKYFFETLGPAIASAVTGGTPPPPSPAPAPPRYQPKVIMPPVQNGDPSPFMDRVSGPAFLHLPGTDVLILATMDYADNVLLTRSADLGQSWSNATKMMPQVSPSCRVTFL